MKIEYIQVLYCIGAGPFPRDGGRYRIGRTVDDTKQMKMARPARPGMGDITKEGGRRALYMVRGERNGRRPCHRSLPVEFARLALGHLINSAHTVIKKSHFLSIYSTVDQSLWPTINDRSFIIVPCCSDEQVPSSSSSSSFCSSPSFILCTVIESVQQPAQEMAMSRPEKNTLFCPSKKG